MTNAEEFNPYVLLDLVQTEEVLIWLIKEMVS